MRASQPSRYKCLSSATGPQTTARQSARQTRHKFPPPAPAVAHAAPYPPACPSTPVQLSLRLLHIRLRPQINCNRQIQDHEENEPEKKFTKNTRARHPPEVVDRKEKQAPQYQEPVCCAS